MTPNSPRIEAAFTAKAAKSRTQIHDIILLIDKDLAVPGLTTEVRAGLLQEKAEIEALLNPDPVSPGLSTIRQ